MKGNPPVTSTDGQLEGLGPDFIPQSNSDEFLQRIRPGEEKKITVALIR